MAIRNSLRTQKSKKKLPDTKLRAALRQQIMGDLSLEGGLDPIYRADVLSEKDFEVRMDEMPLVVVWNDHETLKGWLTACR